MQVEFELTMKCNYNCEYCLLDKNIPDCEDLNKLSEFQKMLHDKYPNEVIFVFGGEPTLHKYFNEIINNFYNLKQKFVIQTNFSKSSANRINTLDVPAEINISIHPSQFNLDDFIYSIANINKNITIKTIDVMFNNINAIKIYHNIVDTIDEKYKPITHILPVADFYDLGIKNNLKIYNIMKKTDTFFEKYQVSHPQTSEITDRSVLWENEFNNNFSTIGSPCLYKNKYVLYSADLNEYSCCYRENNDICPHHCFLM